MSQKKLLKNSALERPKLSVLHHELSPQLEEFLQQKRTAEIGLLAGSISNEISAPLEKARTTLASFEDLIQSKLYTHDDVVELVQTIKIATEHFGRIENRLSRLSNTQKRLYSLVDLTEIAQSAVKKLKTRLDEANINLEFKISGKLMVNCDYDQIEEIVVNIVSNAAHSLEPLDDRVRTVCFTIAESGEWQQLRIWNNGTVIPAEIQAKLLSPKKSGKEETRGSGLAVSKSVMEVHKGTLTLTSSNEWGTELVLSFPHPSTQRA